MGAWQVWAPYAPDRLTAGLRVYAPPDPERPPAVAVFGTVLGAEPDARHLLDGLIVRVGAYPTSAFLERAPYRDTRRHLAERGLGDDRPDGHEFIKSEFFRRPLPEGAVEALVENLREGRVPRQSRELDFTPWGGAYNRVPAEATAFAHRDERFLLLHAALTGADASGTERKATRGWLKRSWETVHPWGSGGAYPNFPDSDLDGWACAYHGENLDRLARVKGRYNPDGFFGFHQSVPGPRE